MFRVSAERSIFHLNAEYLLQFLNVSSLTAPTAHTQFVGMVPQRAFDANKSGN
jgi:hypothetical protein